MKVLSILAECFKCSRRGGGKRKKKNFDLETLNLVCAAFRDKLLAFYNINTGALIFQEVQPRSAGSLVESKPQTLPGVFSYDTHMQVQGELMCSWPTYVMSNRETSTEIVLPLQNRYLSFCAAHVAEVLDTNCKQLACEPVIRLALWLRSVPTDAWCIRSTADSRRTDKRRISCSNRLERIYIWFDIGCQSSLVRTSWRRCCFRTRNALKVRGWSFDWVTPH